MGRAHFDGSFLPSGQEFPNFGLLLVQTQQPELSGFLCFEAFGNDGFDAHISMELCRKKASHEESEKVQPQTLSRLTQI
jgi:hypothetical protein